MMEELFVFCFEVVFQLLKIFIFSIYVRKISEWYLPYFGLPGLNAHQAVGITMGLVLITLALYKPSEKEPTVKVHLTAHLTEQGVLFLTFFSCWLFHILFV